MTDLTNADGFELVDAQKWNKPLGQPGEYVDATDKVSIDRWTKHGHDRLYLNGLATGDGWISLKDGSSDGERWTKVTAEYELDGDELTIEVGRPHRRAKYVITVKVHGDGFGDADERDEQATENDTEEDATGGAAGSEEVRADGGQPTAHGDDGERAAAPVSDEQIEAALERHEDTDHEDAHSVADIRDLLDYIQTGVENGWTEYTDNIEDDHSPTHVVAETADLVVLDTGEWALYDEELNAYDGPVAVDDVARDVVAAIHHGLARDHTDRDWGVTYPLVVAKPDGTDAGQRYIEAVINGIVRRGVSPGGAWAYYGVEIRGNSQSQWARRQGRDQSTVSEAVGRAKQALGGRRAGA